MPGKLINGECLEEMQGISPKSIDLVLCDLPYGTTNCKFDSVIPFEPMWEKIKHVLSPMGTAIA